MWVYMVASLSGTLYIGVTNNIERQVWEPKTGQFDGFAGRYHCDRRSTAKASTLSSPLRMKSLGRANRCGWVAGNAGG